MAGFEFAIRRKSMSEPEDVLDFAQRPGPKKIRRLALMHQSPQLDWDFSAEIDQAPFVITEAMVAREDLPGDFDVFSPEGRLLDTLPEAWRQEANREFTRRGGVQAGLDAGRFMEDFVSARLTTSANDPERVEFFAGPISEQPLWVQSSRAPSGAACEFGGLERSQETREQREARSRRSGPAIPTGFIGLTPFPFTRQIT